VIISSDPFFPAAPGMMQEDTPDQNAAAAIALERDLKKLGGLFGLGSADTSAAETVDIDNVFNERVALEVKRKQFLDSGSLDYNKLNEITEQINTLLSGLSPEQRAATENKVSEFVAGVYGGNQTSSGGFPVGDEPAITAWTNPVSENVTPTVLDNTPPPVPGQTGGFEQGEAISSNTETPVHEGQLGDNVYLSQNENVTLTQKQDSAIRRINNLVSKALKDHDITGTLKDMDGNPVPKDSGGYWDHMQEMQNTLRGLRNHAGTLENVDNSVAQDSYQKALDAIRKIEDAIKGHGI
jgi:hypothetical protein